MDSSADPSARADGGLAVPVELDLAGAHAEAVRGWVEGVLGWQAVDPGASTLVPPSVRLIDLGARGEPGAIPSVLVVVGGEDPVELASFASRRRPALVVPWPAGRDQLEERIAQLLASPHPARDVAVALRVSGSAGGVGTTTVALSLGALAAWRGARVLTVVRDRLLAGEVRPVPPGALEAPDLWSRATQLAGVPGARVVRLDAPAEGCDGTAVADADVVVLDAGVGTDTEVLVCRPDAAGLAAAETTTAAAIVVNGGGVAGTGALRRACVSRRTIVLPMSGRVARAGLHGRVPAALPGSWLARLEPLSPRPRVRRTEVAR